MSNPTPSSPPAPARLKGASNPSNQPEEKLSWFVRWLYPRRTWLWVWVVGGFVSLGLACLAIWGLPRLASLLVAQKYGGTQPFSGGLGTLVVAIASAPIAFLVWAVRDRNTYQNLTFLHRQNQLQAQQNALQAQQQQTQAAVTDIQRQLKRPRVYDLEQRKHDLQGVKCVDEDLHEIDWHDARLQDADLTRAKLQKADLKGAYLTKATLVGAQLQGADLTDAVLQGADLRGAKLEGANLTGADLVGANLVGAQLQGADLRGAKLQGAKLQGAKLHGANLEGAVMNKKWERILGGYNGLPEWV